MSTRTIKLTVSPAMGKVSAIVMAPAKPIGILTLAHGAGAGMDHPFMVQLATVLKQAGMATLRFNFPLPKTKRKT